MAADTALSALDMLTRCGRYARWLYDLAAPHLGRRVVEVGAGLGTQSSVMLDAPGSELREFLLTDSDPERVKHLKQRFSLGCNMRSNVRTTTWTLPGPFPSAQVRRSTSSRRARPEPPPRRASVEVYPLERGRARGAFRPDTFVGWNVLEHVEDDVRALGEMRRALEPGGKVVIVCPAGPALTSALDSAVGHFRRYGRRELSRKAEAAGLVPCIERNVNLAGALGWFVTAKVFARTALPEGPSRLFDLLVPLFRLWEDRLPVPWGLSVLFVGEKRGHSTTGHRGHREHRG